MSYVRTSAATSASFAINDFYSNAISIVTPGSLKQPSDDYEVDLVDNPHGPGVNVVGSSD